MQPGDGLVQPAWAIRCVSGGIPPVLLAIDQRGELTFTLLAGVDGGRLPGAAMMNIGPAVRARGRLSTVGTQRVLRVESLQRVVLGEAGGGEAGGGEAVPGMVELTGLCGPSR